jgi:urease accessory protein
LFASALPNSETFAGNRANGRIELTITAAGGGSRRQRVHEAGALRLRFPNVAAGDALDAVIINTAGGMTGGDRFAVDAGVEAGASLTVTTAAAEKVYRSLGPATRLDIKLRVDARATLAWLPQETILFDHVRVRRSIEADVAADASFVLAEGVVFGRSAMGETVRAGSVFDRWRVRLAGRLVFAESLRLDGAIAEGLARRAVAGGGVAVASVLKYPGDDDAVAAVRSRQKIFAGEVGVSAWNGIAVARLVAGDGAALRRDLTEVVTALHGGRLPRLWLN